MLRNFVAVMKDSFREAVDGFIIYVMLALAAITILIAASISFEPDSGDAGFPVIVSHFHQVFRNRGADIEEVGTRVKFGPFTTRQSIPLTYTASDVQKLDANKGHAGKYKLRLTVKAGGRQAQNQADGGPDQPVPQLDTQGQDVNLAFRTVVYCWAQKQVPEQYLLIQFGGASGEGAADRVELLADDADPEAALAARSGGTGRWGLYAVPRPVANDVNRRSLALLRDLLKLGDADEALFKWLKAEFRRQAGLDLGTGGAEAKGKDAAEKAKLPEFITRGLWKLVKQERKPEDIQSLTRDELLAAIDRELARMDDEQKATIGTVTPEDMQDFIRNQFLVHGDIDQAQVTLRPPPLAGRGDRVTDYQFDVELTVPNGAKGWPHKTYILFGLFGGGESSSLGPAMFIVQDKLVNSIGASITLLVAVILTGFFIPNMLRKGSLDLLLVKPMSRFELLLYKYLGGLIFMFLVTGITVGGVWLVLAIRSGNWNPTFLLSIFFVTFIFAVLYALSTLVAVLTRSAIAAILITSVFMVFMGVMGFVKSVSDGVRAITEKEADKKGWAYTAIDITNDVLPRYNDVMKLNSLALRDAYFPPAGGKVARQIEPPSWFASVGISVAYIVVFLGLAYWRFLYRDP